MALHLNHRSKNRKAKGSQPLLQLESLTRWKLGSKRRTSGANESRMTSGSGEQGNFEDPYTFIDSQSLQPEPPKTPLTHQQGEGGAGRAGKIRTPQSRKKQQRTPLSITKKSPAEIKEEQLRQREEEDLERALEESRREMARVERRQRQQKREEKESKEEEVDVIGVSQDSSRQVEEVLGIVSASQGMTEGSSVTDHDKVTTSTDQVFDIGDLTDDLSQSTPPLNGVSTPSNTTTPYSKLSSVCRTPIVKVKKLLHSPSSGVSIPAKKVVPPASAGGQGVWSGGVEWGQEGREGRLSETPPLEGDEVMVEAEGEVEHVEGGGMEGERVCDGEGVEGEREGGFNSVTWNAHGSSEHSTDVETANDPPVQSSQITHCDSNSQQPSHLLQKRHSLLLSLRKGKKRLSSSMRTDEQDPSPSSKKTKLSPHQTTTTECVEGEGSDTGPSVAASRAKKSRSDQTKRATRTELPELFAPEGVNPASYTATILHRFNCYIHQLHLAQARVTTRVPWSQPVAVYHLQPPHTLDYRYCQLRHSSRKAAITNGWPTIDLNTGRVTRLTPRAKSTSRPLSTRSNKRHKRLSCETDDSSILHQHTPQTPVRDHHSQKRKKLCEDISKEVLDQPLHHGNSISAAAHSTTPDPPQVSVDTAQIETDLTLADRDPSTDGTTASDLPSSSTAVVPPAVQLDSSNEVDGNLAGGFSGDRRPDRTQGMPAVSSVEISEEIKVPPRSHKRRRTARFLDDSDSDTEPAVDRSFNTCENSKYSTSSDVIGTKNRTVGEVVDKVPVEVNQQKSVSPYASALAAFGRGKRLKRVSLGPKYSTPDHITSHHQPEDSTSHHQPDQTTSNDVIDLTEDVSSVSNDLPANQELRGGREEERIPCPLCAELFPASAVEDHAAICLEPQAPSPQPQRRTAEKAHPVKQMSLLALRLNKTNVPLPSSYSELTDPSAGWHSAESHGAGYSEEDDGGREEEGEREGTPSSDQERVDSGPQVYECEGGGYQVDPATISSSPIRTFRRITDLDPQERAGYYNQFSKKRRGGRGGGGGDATWGRAEFSEMMEYTSARRGDRGRGRSSRRGRGQGGGRGRGRGKWRTFRGRGKRFK